MINRLNYISVIIMSTLFILIYSVSTGVFQRYVYSYDSAIFMYLGRSLLNGYIPYVDTFEIKGPMIWGVEALGHLIYNGRYGIHILEIINFNFISLLAYKSARLYLDEKKSFLAVIVCIVFWGVCIEGGNTIEEFSSLYAFFALYITLKLSSGKVIHKRLCYMLTGVCAAIAFFFRVTDCVIIGASIKNKVIRDKQNTKNIMKKLSYIVVGAVMIFMPVMIYFAVNNALMPLIDGMILSSLKYSGENKEYRQILFAGVLLFPTYGSLIAIKRKNSDMGLLLIIMTVMIILLYGVIGITYRHYLTLTIPCFLLSYIYMVDNIKYIKESKIKLTILMICIAANLPFVYVTAGRGVSNVFEIANFGTMGKQDGELFADDIAHYIGKNKDSVYTYSLTNTEIPYLAGTMSKSKYFCSQIQWSRDASFMDEIYNDFVDCADDWVITMVDNNEYGDIRIKRVLDEKYELIYEKYGYLLYKKIQ